MLFCEIMAVYSENRTKPTSTLCGQNGELMNIKLHSVGLYLYLKCEHEGP
jgi:hypothetical protein